MRSLPVSAASLPSAHLLFPCHPELVEGPPGPIPWRQDAHTPRTTEPHMTTRQAFLATSGATVLAARLNADAQALPHLLVGTVPTDAGMPPVFAQKTGIFHRNGV